MTPLILGFVGILVLMVVVVVNASHVFLERRSLVSWADGAASAAVQEVDLVALYTGEAVDVAPVMQDRAAAAVQDYVARHDVAGGFDAFAVRTVLVEPDGRVRVELVARTPVVFDAGLTAGFGDGFTIDATASARATLQ